MTPSFYQKLATKLGEASAASEEKAAATGQKPASPAAPGKPSDPPGDPHRAANDPPAEEAQPDGTEFLEIDLFQSEERMIVFAQMVGVSIDDLEITIDEEENTVTIQGAEKRPPLPPLPPNAAQKKGEGEPAEKGRYVKQEAKWRTLYRKIYAPAPFDSGEAKAYLDRGVFVAVLPTKKPGVGKKLAVKEISDETRQTPPQK